MPTSYSDTFTTAKADLNGTPVEVGGLNWEVITGSWSTSSGKPQTSTPVSSNPFVVLETNKPDTDVTVSADGNDAIYFRVIDAQNWWRLIVDRQTHTESYQTEEWVLNYYHGGEHVSPPGGIVNTAGNYWETGYVPIHQWFKTGSTGGEVGVWTLTVGHTHDTDDNLSTTSDRVTHTHEYILQSQSKTGATGTGESVSHDYRLRLQKCENGIVSDAQSYYLGNSAPATIRVVTRSSTISCYSNGSKRFDYVTSTFQSETKNGFGRGSVSDADYNSALDNFSLTTVDPPLPVIQSPAANGLVDRSRPTLIALLGAYDIKAKMQWQIATDAGFTTDLKTITEPDTALKDPGQTTSYTLTSAEALTKGIWYIRGKEIDALGASGPWTNAVSFTVAHTPGVLNMQPTGGAGVAHEAINRLSWKFSDPDPDDSQTAFQVVIERNDTGAVIVDSGKLLSTDQFWDYAIDASLRDVTLRWKVRVWDKEDTPSNYSSYAVFTPALAGTVSITFPPDGSQVNTGNPKFQWTFTAAGGRVQAQYQIIVVNTTNGMTVWDSGALAGQSSSRQPAQPILSNEQNYSVTVTVTDSLGLADSDTVLFSSVYVAPEVIGLTVETAVYESLGYVDLTWDPDADPSFKRWRIYRRIDGGEWSILVELPDPNQSNYHDYMAVSQTTYEYSIVQVVERFGEEVESAVASTAPIIAVNGGWWLVDAVTPELGSVKLHNVKEAGYQTNRERAELIVVGRGRHVDIGEDIGRSGQLVAQLRDSQITGTAREKKKKLETMILQGESVYLRNPYGDMFLVSPGDIQIGYIAGTGDSEHVDVTVPYSEVGF